MRYGRFTIERPETARASCRPVGSGPSAKVMCSRSNFSFAACRLVGTGNGEGLGVQRDMLSAESGNGMSEVDSSAVVSSIRNEWLTRPGIRTRDRVG